MLSGLRDLLKMKHYLGTGLLRGISAIQFWISIVLVAFPLYGAWLLNILAKIFGADSQLNQHAIGYYLLIYGVPVLVSINLIREYCLSKNQIIGYDFKKELIRQLLDFLMDNYLWKGTCRATLFVIDPKDKKKISIYERITAGEGPGNFDQGKCFFRKNQGLPGKAWANAWSGDNIEAIVNHIQFGNVPSEFLRDNRVTHTKFFKEKFGVVDEDIYESMGDNKFKIKSYMSIGILGEHQKLVAVLSIDSEEENKFTDFEQLPGAQKGATLREEKGVTISTEGENLGDILNVEKLGKSFERLLPVLRKKFGEGTWEETSEVFKKVSLILHMFQSKEVGIVAHVATFVFPLAWSLKQIRTILTKES
jgi:hypothetical protein